MAACAYLTQTNPYDKLGLSLSTLYLANSLPLSLPHFVTFEMVAVIPWRIRSLMLSRCSGLMENRSPYSAFLVSINLPTALSLISGAQEKLAAFGYCMSTLPPIGRNMHKSDR